MDPERFENADREERNASSQMQSDVLNKMDKVMSEAQVVSGLNWLLRSTNT